jgi:hypothetical protein
LEANQAVSFLICLKYFRDEASVQSLILENRQTQEKMVIRGTNEFKDPVVSISRCSMGTNELEFIKVMCQDLVTIHKHRSIEFNPL